MSAVTLEGSYEGRVFDQRELKFEVGERESLGLPIGVEKALMAMEQGEESLFTIKPKYDTNTVTSLHAFIFIFHFVFYTVVWLVFCCKCFPFIHFYIVYLRTERTFERFNIFIIRLLYAPTHHSKLL